MIAEQPETHAGSGSEGVFRMPVPALGTHNNPQEDGFFFLACSYEYK